MYTKKYLPSKKIQITILVLVIIGSIILIYPWLISLIKKSGTNTSVFSTGLPEPLVTSQTSMNQGLDRDADGDTIPDWQEILFDLDPNKRDSDGDGNVDQLPVTDPAVLESFSEINAYDKIGLALSNSLGNVPADQITEEAVGQVISQEVIDQATAIKNSLKKYGKLDIVIGDDDTDAVIKYVDQVITITDTVPDPIVFAKDIFDKILKIQDPSREIITLETMVKKLLVLEAPARFMDVHIAMINDLYGIIQILNIPDTDEFSLYVKNILAQELIQSTEKNFSNVVFLKTAYTKPI